MLSTIRPEENGCCILKRFVFYEINYSFLLLLFVSILVLQAQLEDSGPYMCMLNTDPMKSKMGILNVIIRPGSTEVTGARAVAEEVNVR